MLKIVYILLKENIAEIYSWTFIILYFNFQTTTL